MNSNIKPHRYSRLTFCSRVISVFSLIVGLIVLLGWSLDIKHLKSIVPGFVTMKVNTALGFILAGISLRFLQPKSLTPRHRQIALISAGLVCLLGFLTLLEYGLQWNLRIDELLVKQVPDPMAAFPPGRMPFLTALVFFLLGFALFLLGLERWGSKVAAQILALLTSIFPLVGLIGYLYNIQPLYQELVFSSMALHTAVTAELLCLGILLAQPDRGVMESFTSDHSGGVMARRLLPFVILAPIIVGWPRLLSQQGGFYDTIFGIVLVVLTFILSFVIILWLNARSLNEMDTAREQAEKALRESEERLRLATEATRMGTWDRDLRGNGLFWSPNMERLMGFEPGTFPGTYEAFAQLIHPDDWNVVSAAQQNARNNGGHYQAELRFVLRDGRVRWGLVSGQMLFDEHGTPARLVGIDLDITERKQIEQALRESEERFRTLIEQASDGFFVHDTNGRFLDVNQRACESLGYSREELLQMSVFDVEQDYTFEQAQKVWAEVCPGRASTLYGHQRRKDGTIFPVEVRWSCFDFRGQRLFLDLARDITERKQAEQALHETNQTLQTFIKASPLAIVALDMERKVKLWNPAAERMFGWTAAEVMGQLLPTIPAEEMQNQLALRERFVRSGGTAFTNIETRRKRKDGSIIEVSVSFAPLRDTQDAIVGTMGIIADITNLKRAELELRESQARLAGIISSAMDAIITVDSEQRIMLFNAAAEKMFGCQAKEAIGQSLDQFIPERFRRGHQEHIKDFSQTNVSRRSMGSLGAIYGLRANGEEFPIEASISQIEVGGRKIFTIILRDITERIRAEEALRQSEEHFRVIFEGAGVGNVECDARTGRFLLVNRKICEITGYAAEELLTMNFNDITYPEDRDRNFDLYRRFINKQVPDYSVEKRYVRKNGAPVWVQVSSTLLCDEAGQPWRTVAVVQDISERKRAEEALRESEHNLATAQSVAHIGSWIAEVSETGELSSVTWSDEAYRIFGSEPGGFTVTLEEFFRRVHPSDRESIQQAMEATLEGGAPYALEHRIILPDGGIRVLYEQAEIIRDEQTGRPLKVIGTVQDITERRRVEEEIRLLNAGLEERVALRTEELAAANRELEAFAYSVSHDLRAPLRAIDGFSRILLEDFATGLPPDAEEHLRLVRDNTQQMGRLIDDLLGFSRLNRQPLKKHRIATGALVRQILADLQRDQEGRRVEVAIAELPDCYADQALLKQVFINLLTNAFKFTSHCEKAVIQIGCLTTGPNGSPPVYFVKDNGVGFDMKYAHKLFQVFQRLHRAEDYEGTGVGLAIIQRIILRHGGRVWAEGVPNQGATFFFTLEGDLTV